MTSLRSICSAALLAGIMAWPATAAPLPLRSGEHEDFTRLVFPLPNTRTNWSLEKTADGYRLTLTDKNKRFDLSDAFVRIPRTRVRELKSDKPGELDLILGCDCEVKAFRFGTSYLVLDVSGIADPIDPQSETPVQIATQHPKTPKTPTGLSYSFSSADTQAGAGLDLGETVKIEPKPSLAPDPVVPLKPKVTSRSTADFIDRQVAIKDAQARLIEQLGRAASQGLLEPNSQLLGTPQKTSATPQDQAPEPKEQIAKAPVVLDNINLIAQSSVDREFAAIADALKHQGSGAVCSPNSHVNIAHWGDDTSFKDQIGRLRRSLSNQRDIVSDETAKKLAKAYLHYSFGAEAQSVLQSANLDRSAEPYLWAIADIMDGRPERARVFADQHNCKGISALWAFLAKPDNSDLNTKAVLFEFGALPPHLRQHLGPQLSDAFITAGDTASAKSILKAVERGVTVKTPEHVVSTAKVDLAEGDIVKANQKLERISNSNSQPAVQAFIDLANGKIERNDPITASDAAHAAALALEHRESLHGEELRKLHVKLRIKSEDYPTALKALTDIRERDGKSHIPPLRSEIYNAITQTTDDLTFSRYALAEASQDTSNLDEATKNAMASRLVALGFMDSAEALIANDIAGEEGDKRRKLWAEIALQTQRPKRAEAVLLGLEGKDVELLRARAREISGEYESAQKIYSDLDMKENSESAAWLAGDWQTLQNSDNSPYSEISEVLANPTIQDTTIEGVLAKNRDLLEKSQDIRARLDAILDRNVE